MNLIQIQEHGRRLLISWELHLITHTLVIVQKLKEHTPLKNYMSTHTLVFDGMIYDTLGQAGMSRVVLHLLDARLVQWHLAEPSWEFESLITLKGLAY